jgi:hypothetical protein
MCAFLMYSMLGTYPAQPFFFIGSF